MNLQCIDVVHGDMTVGKPGFSVPTQLSLCHPKRPLELRGMSLALSDKGRKVKADGALSFLY